MNKLNLIMRLLLTIVLVSAIASCAGSKVTESTGEYFDDMIISSKVRTALLADSRIKSGQISVETFKGVVQLSGFVNSQGVITRAVELARKTKGVKAVNNSLVIK
jgi:hyperosmotically inducible protein